MLCPPSPSSPDLYEESQGARLKEMVRFCQPPPNERSPMPPLLYPKPPCLFRTAGSQSGSQWSKYSPTWYLELQVAECPLMTRVIFVKNTHLPPQKKHGQVSFPTPPWRSGPLASWAQLNLSSRGGSWLHDFASHYTRAPAGKSLRRPSENQVYPLFWHYRNRTSVRARAPAKLAGCAEGSDGEIDAGGDGGAAETGGKSPPRVHEGQRVFPGLVVVLIIGGGGGGVGAVVVGAVVMWW